MEQFLPMVGKGVEEQSPVEVAVGMGAVILGGDGGTVTYTGTNSFSGTIQASGGLGGLALFVSL